ncbi:MAG: MMPL family transporter [Candidatus Eremiobacteraeota bacterium]|nr:MMPL family transporter [Candidatus Eremiobacteraeota bacterium]
MLCLVFAGSRLEFSNDRTRMLDPRHPAQQRFEEYRRAFGASPEVVLLVTCSDEELRRACAEALVKQLSAESRLQEVSGILEMPLLPQQSLYYTSPENLDQLEDRLKLQETFQDGRLPPQSEVTRELLHSLRSRGHEPYQSPFGPSPPLLERRRYLQLTPETLVVAARVAPGPGSDEALLDRLRARVNDVMREHAGVEVVLGGDFVAFCDDGRAARRTALQVSLLSLILVHSFFRWAFGRPQPARLALLTVLVALCWSCAWVALVSPRLNLITLNFTATLIGLGMDFNVQMLYRFFEERDHGSDPEPALKKTLASVGKENFVGALATSAAFFSLMATPFLGVAQLGMISGVGVLLCWLASITILPALLLISGAQGKAPPPGPWQRWEQNWRSRPRLVLLIAATVSLLAGLNLHRPRFDYNLLHMMPENALAIHNDREFHQRCGMCSLYACSLAAGEQEMRRRTEEFRKLPGVARVESPADWVPENPGQRRPRIHELLARRGETPEWLKELPEPGQRLSTEQLLELKKRFNGGDAEVSQVLGQLGPGPIQDGLSHFFGEFKQDLRSRHEWLDAQREEPEPQWSQLPADLLNRYHQGSLWLIKIYPKEDIWEKASLERFLQELSRVDPQVTGLPLLTQTYLQQLKDSYWLAGRNALLAISLILLLSFRRLDEALWALAPKLLGVVWMLGAMGLLGINFNPANATALPLTLGIGLVFGVHVVHRLRGHPQHGVFAGSTGNAVLVSGVSTVLGYISLVTSPYRGIASLGLIMGLGVISSLITSLVVLPVVRQILVAPRPESSRLPDVAHKDGRQEKK